MKEPCGKVEIFWGKAGECGKILITLQIKTFRPLPLLAFRRTFGWALPVLGWLCWGLEVEFFLRR